MALPPNITLVTDPGNKVKNLSGVRWKAPEETDYPSTFVPDKNRTAQFEQISRGHGDHITASQIFAQIPGN